MKTRIVVVSVIIAAIAMLGGALFFNTFKRDWSTETTPSTGEAYYNRFFALQNILKNIGQPASSGVLLNKILPDLDSGDTVVIGDDIGSIKPDDAANLAEWVREGGHLVFSPTAYAKQDIPLLDELDLLANQESKVTCVELSVSGGKESMPVCGSGFHLKKQALAHAQVMIGDNAGKGLVFARVSEGDGTVSMLSNMGVLADNSLKKQPQQQFALRLLAPNFGHGHVYLLYELIGSSFWVNLFVRGWPALIASLLLILGWMLMRSERLGPLVPAPSAHRRALLEHIHAVGEFLFRRDGGRSLHQLACEAVLARLHRRDPASVMLKQDELYAWLAQRSRLEASLIEHAFRSPANAAAFRGSMTTLARLRSHL
ncbi:DUF4350 domain-containing protein [Dyella acidisoli]|uniref:DUF4350 domain-containing protein n=1 Tax=Dyella acidisoli TaxID=1867834 RepID=A0ABQ5XQ15_9GAMM|nr:hypothetical protein [Dyella acidisoli]GLQ93294.1 hypothetical protein GCM10007901_22450 [Dyella acidisoli]